MVGTSRDCALIPAHDEERTIREVVTRVRKLGIVPIVIDDFSGDRTYQVAKEAGAKVIRLRRNLGKGGALKAGLNYVFSRMPNTENVIFIDADMQYDPKDAMPLLRMLHEGEVDIVVGYRDWARVPLRHRLGNAMWRISFNVMFGTDLKDTNCGLMAMTIRTAKMLRSSISGGYIIENAMLAKAVQLKLRMGQAKVGVSYHEKSGMSRGIRMVGGITLYILIKGLQYRIQGNV